MENLLLKLAKQLDSLDEASLMALWSKYATITSRFEPTRRWEESCLIFSLIQAKHWKNQLFNYNWSQQRQPPLKNGAEEEELNPEFGLDFDSGFAFEEDGPQENAVKEECRILKFQPLPGNNQESAGGTGEEK